ncbi:MAG: glycosyltransferase [Deltaproteobacteria bacterium]|nr:glycosyltransferase [Deltaproteobacteria bacterium]
MINGEPFNFHSATGITISNLFRGWPIDKIAQIYSANIKPDNAICKNNWKLSNSDLLLVSQYLSIINNHYFVTSHKTTLFYVDKGAIDSSYSRKSLIRRLLIPWVDLVPYHFSAKFLLWLEEFKPELIYSTLGNIRMVNTVQRISRYLSIPVVPHFMDDWLTTYSVNGKSMVTSLQRAIARNITGRLLNKVSLGLGICDAMAAEYGRRYQRRFDAFMNPVEVISDYPVSVKEVTGTMDPVRFVYIGGLHLSRFENLKDIGNVICSLREEGHNIELHIYAPSGDVMQYESFLTLDNSVRVCGTLPPNDIQQTLCEYDVAVHVESFFKKNALYTRLSLSTKIPQYLAAGLPVLAYGPADVASCRYVGDYECGKVVGERDSKALSKAIYELASNPELRLQLGRNSWNVANERHNIHKEQERFREVLLQVAAESAS